MQKAGIIKTERRLLAPIHPSTPAGQVVAKTAKARDADLRWVDLADTPGLRAANLALAQTTFVRLGEIGVHSLRAGRR